MVPTHVMSCVSALKHFFGDHPDGETRFIAEVKQLSKDDRVELAELLREEGYNVTEVSA